MYYLIICPDKIKQPFRHVHISDTVAIHDKTIPHAVLRAVIAMELTHQQVRQRLFA